MEWINVSDYGEPERTDVDQDSMVDENLESTIEHELHLTEDELCETYGYNLAMSPTETITQDEESSWGTEGSGESRMSGLKHAAEVDNSDLPEPEKCVGNRRVSVVRPSCFPETGDEKVCSDNFDLLETCLFSHGNPIKPQDCVTTLHSCNQQLNVHSPNNELVHTASDTTHADQRTSPKKSYAETTALVQDLKRKMTLGQKMKFYAWFNSGLSIQEAAVKSKIPDLIPPPLRHRNCNLSKERLRRLSKILPNVFLQRQFVYEAYFAGMNPKEIMRYLLMSLGLEELMDDFAQQLLSEQCAQQQQLLKKKRLAAACASPATPANDEPAPQEQDHLMLQDNSKSLDDPKSTIDPKEELVNLKSTELKKYCYLRNQGLPIGQAASEAKMPGQNDTIVAHPDCKHSWQKLCRAAQGLPDMVSRERFLAEVYFNGKSPREVLKTLSCGNYSRRPQSKSIAVDATHTEKLLAPESQTTKTSAEILMPRQPEHVVKIQNPVALVDTCVPSQVFDGSSDQLQRSNISTVGSFGQDYSQSASKNVSESDKPSTETDQPTIKAKVLSSRDDQPQESSKLSSVERDKLDKYNELVLRCRAALDKAMSTGLTPANGTTSAVTSVPGNTENTRISTHESPSDEKIAGIPKMGYVERQEYYRWRNKERMLSNGVDKVMAPLTQKPHLRSSHSSGEMTNPSTVVPSEHGRNKLKKGLYCKEKEIDASTPSTIKLDGSESGSKTLSKKSDEPSSGTNVKREDAIPIVEISSDDSDAEVPKMSLAERKNYYKRCNLGSSRTEALRKAVTPEFSPETHLPHPSCKYSWKEVKTMSRLITQEHYKREFEFEVYYRGKRPVDAMKNILPDDLEDSTSQNKFNDSAHGQNGEEDIRKEKRTTEKRAALLNPPHDKSRGKVDEPIESSKPSSVGLNKLDKYNGLLSRCRDAFDKAIITGLIPANGTTSAVTSVPGNTENTRVSTLESSSDEKMAEIPKMGYVERQEYYRWRNTSNGKGKAIAPLTHIPNSRSTQELYCKEKEMDDVIENVRPGTTDGRCFPNALFNQSSMGVEKHQNTASQDDEFDEEEMNKWRNRGLRPDNKCDFEEVDSRRMNELTETQAETISPMNSHHLKKYYTLRKSGLSSDDVMSKMKGKHVLTTRDFNESYTPHPSAQYPKEILEKMSSGLPEKFQKEQFFIHVQYGGMDSNAALKLVESYSFPDSNQLSSHQKGLLRGVQMDYRKGKGDTQEDDLTQMTSPSRELDKLDKIGRVGRIKSQERGSNSHFGESVGSGSNPSLEVPQDLSENPWLLSKTRPGPASQLQLQANRNEPVVAQRSPAPYSPSTPQPAPTVFPSYPKPARFLNHEDGTVGHKRPVIKEVTQSIAENHQPDDNSLECFIVPADYPNTCLSDSQMDAIEENILEAILETDDEVTKPCFKYSFRRNGCYGVVCNDEFSLQWLYKYLMKYQPWEGISLKLMTNQFSKIKAVVKLPPSRSDDTKKIMKFIEKQNPSLNVRLWTVLRRLDEGNTLIDVLIDDESASVLKMSSRISFKLGIAEISIDGVHSTGLNSCQAPVASPKNQSAPVSLPQLQPTPPPPPSLPSPLHPKRSRPIDTSLGALLRKSAANSGCRDDKLRTSPVNDRKRRARRDRSSSGECKRTKSTLKERLDSFSKIHRSNRCIKDRRRSASPSTSHDRAYPRTIPMAYRRHYTEYPDETNYSWLDWYYPNYEGPSHTSLRKPKPDQRRSSSPSSRVQRAGSIENNEYEPYLKKS